MKGLHCQSLWPRGLWLWLSIFRDKSSVQARDYRFRLLLDRCDFGGRSELESCLNPISDWPVHSPLVASVQKKQPPPGRGKRPFTSSSSCTRYQLSGMSTRLFVIRQIRDSGLDQSRFKTQRRLVLIWSSWCYMNINKPSGFLPHWCHFGK